MPDPRCPRGRNRSKKGRNQEIVAADSPRNCVADQEEGDRRADQPDESESSGVAAPELMALERPGAPGRGDIPGHRRQGRREFHDRLAFLPNEPPIPDDHSLNTPRSLASRLVAAIAALSAS